ncbi:Carbamoyl-phosphate synthase large chain [subsurface metagenome]
MLGKNLRDFDLKDREFDHFGVKEAVLPFNMFPEVDPVLGPEMRSTGEVLGLADSYGLAFFKSQEAIKTPLPLEGTVLITIADRDKSLVLDSAQKFAELGFTILATKGTREFLAKHNIRSTFIRKINEGRPNIIDAIKNGEIHLVVNTPSGKYSEVDDSYIRKDAIKHGILYITTTTAARAATKGIEARRNKKTTVKSLQDYHKDIR